MMGMKVPERFRDRRRSGAPPHPMDCEATLTDKRVVSEPDPPMRRLASETVLTNASFFFLIVSFQSGLPGLLRELKRDTRAGDGFEPDLPTAAAKHRKLRAFEMIHALRELPQYSNRTDLKYRNAINKACEVGDAAILRWIINGPTAEHRLPREEIEPLWNLAVVYYKPGNLSVFELLAEYSTPQQVATLDKNTWGSIRHVELLKWLCDRYEIQLRDDMFARAINRSDAELVDYWISNRPELVPKNILTNVLRRGDAVLFNMIFFNKHRVLDDEERVGLITIATREEDLTLLRLLSSSKTQNPAEKMMPVEALELAAERGLLEFVEELCLHHSGIVTPRALEVAATNGHLQVLKFLCARCDVKEISGTMDSAAINGHLDVVRYLHEYREENCTAQALVGALMNNHDEVAEWLLENRSEVRTAAGLDSLLTRGKTTEWLHYREQWNLVGDKAVDGIERLGEAAFQAGKAGDMTMIRFIVETLKCQGLLTRVYDGAVEIGSLGWLLAIHELDTTRTKRVKFSVIQCAIGMEKQAYRFETLQAERRDVLKWLIMQYEGEDKDESSATSEALALLASQRESNPYRGHYHRYYSHNVDLGEDLATWAENREPTEAEMEMLRRKYTIGLLDSAYRGAAFDWVVEHAVRSISPRFDSWSQRYLTPDVEENDPWGLGVWTLPKQAVARNDLMALKVFHELSQAADIAIYRIDDEVLRAAIATGCLEIAQWYVSVHRGGNLHEPDLLDWAVKYGQVEVAEWLLAGYPQCCTSFSANRLDVLPGHLTPVIIDWFTRLGQDHPALLKHFRPLPVACSLAREGHVELLQRLVNSHSVHDKTVHILNHAAQGGHFRAVKFIVSVMEALFSRSREPIELGEEDRQQVEEAVEAAAIQRKLETVKYLCSKFPTADYSSALREAATRGHVRMVRYLLKNHIPTSGDIQEIRTSVYAAVRRVGYFCHAHGKVIL